RSPNECVTAMPPDIDRFQVFAAASIARPADPLDLATDDVTCAMTRMEEMDVNAVHVVDDGKLTGIISYQAANAAHRDGIELKDALDEEFPAATPECMLNDLYPLAESGLPIALMDEKGKLTGMVRPQDVFHQLTATEEKE